MQVYDDFLVEIHTEELPPKALLKLAQAFCQQIEERVQKINLPYKKIQFFATPRRLAVLVEQLAARQAEQTIERRGPAYQAAFDASGKPTPACIGFARSCNAEINALTKITTEQGEWIGYQQTVAGKSVQELLPAIIEQAATTLPVPKRMRWGDSNTQFVRPVHSVILLYGDQIIDTTILGCRTNRITYGHRFLAPGAITIPHAAAYASLLETEGYVLADFAKRRNLIQQQITQCAKTVTKQGHAFIMDELLDEVTGLVEWPVALTGQFDVEFLTLPKEVLISAMQDHQRYFPMLYADKKLLANFIFVSNIASQDSKRIIHGNERVLRARLADAMFFYHTDQKETLEQRVEQLKEIVFQAKLGTLYDKAQRINQLALEIANACKLKSGDPSSQKTLLGMTPTMITRAALLTKTDLTTNMVSEFPELQGIMGYYYATHAGEAETVALANKEHYLPRFAGDELPTQPISQIIALADRIDTLITTFGINQIPTGDKDPYGLRRAALGVLRILIEKNIALDLKPILDKAYTNFSPALANKEAATQVLTFMQERLRAWYQEQGIPADVFAAVAALNISNPLDMHQRIQAVQAFKRLAEAESLSVANKRVSNILAKYTDALQATAIDPTLFDNTAEKELARQLDEKDSVVTKLYQAGKYNDVLLRLTELRQPIDDFFDQVLVMVDDKKQRENRILLLGKLRALFLQVADIALLQ